MTLIFVIGMLAGLILYYCNVTGILYGLSCSLFLFSMVAILIDLTPLLKKLKVIQDALTSGIQDPIKQMELGSLKKRKHIQYYSILAIICFVGLLYVVYTKNAFLTGVLTGMLVGTFLLTIMYLLLNYLAEILEHELARKPHQD